MDFDFNRPPEASNRLGKHWYAGGLFELDFIADRDLELRREFEEDVATLEPRLDVALAYEPSPRVSAFAQLELSHEFILEDEAELLDPPETRLTVEQAYLTFNEILPGLSMQVGRQLFEDDRDWWYREELDAVRLFYRTERFGVEFSASRLELVGDDFLNRDEPQRTNNLFLIGRYAYREDAEFDAYVFKQDDRAEDEEEDPLFLGVRSIGELGSDFEHWVDAAIVRGTDDGRDIRAYGFDAGITYEPDLRFDPLFTVGAAFGSGDSDPDDDVDQAFRQTGFQQSFYYYGEVLAPELSNLWVLTAGASMYVTDSLSAGFLYHYYEQHRAADELRNAFIFEDPDGVDKHLGQALDFVFSYYGAGGLYADLILGSFYPGDAFPDDAPTAYFGEFIIGYQF
ncbi:MAG: alginate export family protein [Gammaproteobacteria bacterium]